MYIRICMYNCMCKDRERERDQCSILKRESYGKLTYSIDQEYQKESNNFELNYSIPVPQYAKCAAPSVKIE